MYYKLIIPDNNNKLILTELEYKLLNDKTKALYQECDPNEPIGIGGAPFGETRDTENFSRKANIGYVDTRGGKNVHRIANPTNRQTEFQERGSDVDDELNNKNNY